MRGTLPRRRTLSWRVHLAWVTAWFASIAAFTLAGALLGGSDDPLGAAVPPIGTATVLLAYWALRDLPRGQPAPATVRALARLLVPVSMIGLVMGYVFHASRLR